MSNKKMKKEYIVLGIVIVVLIFYLILKKDNKVHYDIPDIKSLVKEDIGEIKITREGKTLILKKEDTKWVIGEKKYPADENKVKNMVDTIAELSLSEMVSRSKNYKPYELGDEKKITVKAYKQDKLLRDFDIGKQASTYGHTFIRIAGDDNIYHARKSFRGYFDQEIDNLRDKVVMKFDKDEITEIRVTAPGQEYHFTKKVSVEKPKPAADSEKEKKKEEPTLPPQPGEEVIQWLTKDGKEGDKSKLDSFINQLSNLSCDKFIDDKEAKDYKDKKPVFKLTLKGNKSYTLSLFEKLAEEGENKDKFPAVSSESAYPFLLLSYKGDNFIKDAKELVKEEKIEEEKEKKIEKKAEAKKIKEEKKVTDQKKKKDDKKAEKVKKEDKGKQANNFKQEK